MTSKSQQAEDIVRSVKPRDTRGAAEAFGLLRELFAPASAMPCPACGHLCDPRDNNAHVRTGYREPHILPYQPGSYLYADAEELAKPDPWEGP